MTIVGKILVFVNLVFSLAVGGLVIVAYATRANWQEAYANKEAQFKAVENDRNQAVADLDAAKKNYDAAVAALAKERDDAVLARDAAKKEAAAATGELATIKQKERGSAADNKAVLEASSSRKDQVKELETALEKVREDYRKVIDDKNKERQARIVAEVESKTYKARNLELEDQVRDMAKELAKSKLGRGGPTNVVARKRGEDNPPPADVEGRIVSTDASSDLVKISIGSDDGLAQGHTLKVFRFDPVPEQSKYLGTIEILSVRPHEAVGRPVSRPTTPLRQGDRVAARIQLGGS